MFEVDEKRMQVRESRVKQTEKRMFESEEQRMQARIRELEDALDGERDGRVRAEKTVAELSFRLDQLQDSLEEQGSSTSAQIELNKKRESEITKLRRDLELANAQFEATESSLRKRHQESVNDLSDQIDYLSNRKIVAEKEKQTLVVELDGLSGQLDSVTKTKVSLEGRVDAAEQSAARLKGQVDDLTRQLNDLTSLKARLTQENFDLQHQVQELDSSNSALAKAKNQLQAQNDDLKRNLDDESRQRQNLQVSLSALQSDYDQLNARLEEEAETSSTLRNTLSKVNADYTALKTRFDKELAARTEELEETRRRLNIRITELEDSCEQLRVRNSSLEKAKAKLANEIKEITIELENTQINRAGSHEAQPAAGERDAGLQGRVNDLMGENNQLRNEKAALEQDLQRLRVANAELDRA
nr:hypothetical protein BaRGS_001201 [Batillaria attramentaria]